MEYRPLGRTGLNVSALGLGCGGFGGIGSAPQFFGQGETREEAFALMDAAVEAGITLFDTADAYGGGRSEACIGQWLRERGPRLREQIVITTKTYHPMAEGEDRGLSRPRILRQIETSLRRLGIDRVELYVIHQPDPQTPLEETLGALDQLVREGKVGHVGASNVTAAYLADALGLSDRGGWSRFGWVQNEYSLLHRDDERELLPLSSREGLGYTPFSPLGGGWLTGKYRQGEAYPEGSRMTLRGDMYLSRETAATWRRLDGLAAYAAERGESMASLALSWVLAHPQVSSALIGPRRPDQLAALLRAVDGKGPAPDRQALSAFFEG